MKLINRLSIAIFVLFLIAQAGYSADPVAVVIQMRGKVNFTRAKESKAHNARKGTVLYDGDKISTLDASICAVKFWDDKSLLRIKESSTCVIEAKKVENRTNKNIIAEVGSFLTNIFQPGGSFSVTTPTSVASVKGTEWWTLQLKDGRTIYICLDGLVDAESGAGKFLVKEGQTAIFADRNQTPEIRLTKPDEIPSWEDDIDELRNMEIEFIDPDGKTRKMIIDFQQE